ncbi:MAG: shikimate kinase [Acidobacteriota bacterium]
MRRDRLFLVGFMGAGKTRLGGLVAEQLGIPLIDTDHRVEDAAGLKVAEIFARYGETYFRELEHSCLRRLAEVPRAVVATGGGVFTFPRNRQLIASLGISLWIDVDFDTIVGRMSERGRLARPLFQDESRARALFIRRRVHYREADLKVDVQPGEAAESAAARILRSLREENCVTS